jgi:hypothetical protein
VPPDMEETFLQGPKVVVVWLTLLLRIRQFPVSNLCPKTGYPQVFRDFPQSFQANTGIVP